MHVSFDHEGVRHDVAARDLTVADLRKMRDMDGIELIDFVLEGDVEALPVRVANAAVSAVIRESNSPLAPIGDSAA